tara:strand:- start:131 stop:739 length:609 start_codon:yes stop_codon:yes gene_type:complete
MPINYNNGKIYKIINPQNEIIYIGSTAQEQLCYRFSTHKHRGNGNKIILLENYPCNSKQELVKKEQEFIEQYDNLLNQVRAFNSEEYHKEYTKEYRENTKNKISQYKKEYNKKNKDKIFEKVKVYRENNKDKIAEKKKVYYENNKDEILEKNKVYYEEHKDILLENRKVKLICECGCKINKQNMLRHKKTKNHIKLMENIII